ncbi:uncharacterized protein [Venturia canescens]|uniref:uncharacterized protein n=1 Tax=Venturia canescens TaxID=32260 RepID=UPI001C9CECB0|nr:uncharacterized protein LOC122417311 [Venturia canescens]
MSGESFERHVLSLHGEAKWREIVSLGASEENDQGRRLLWVWPRLNDLDWLKKMLDKYKLDGIASIGCGSGLFEWIIQQHSGSNVIGIETDKSWWHSGYSAPLFLKNTVFVEAKKEEAELKIPPGYALFFCYFNNGTAFANYMKNFKGRVVIAIGPDEGIFRTTDPLPFDKKFEKFGWSIRNVRRFANGKDLAVIYTK